MASAQSNCKIFQSVQATRRQLSSRRELAHVRVLSILRTLTSVDRSNLGLYREY